MSETPLDNPSVRRFAGGRLASEFASEFGGASQKPHRPQTRRKPRFLASEFVNRITLTHRRISAGCRAIEMPFSGAFTADWPKIIRPASTAEKSRFSLGFVPSKCPDVPACPVMVIIGQSQRAGATGGDAGRRGGAGRRAARTTRASCAASRSGAARPRAAVALRRDAARACVAAPFVHEMFHA